jgi:hypothetical protein
LGVKEFAGLLEFLGPLDELAHPGDTLFVVIAAGFAAFVFPVGGNAFFGEAMHLLCADLNLEGLAAMQHGGVQGLVEIRARHGDVVLEAAGNRAPNVVDHAESGVTVAFVIGDNANGQKIVDLFEAAFLADDLAVQGIEAFYAGFKFGGNTGFDELALDGRLHLFKEALMNGRFVGDFLLQGEEGFRLEVAEGEIFQFAAHDTHA